MPPRTRPPFLPALGRGSGGPRGAVRAALDDVAGGRFAGLPVTLAFWDGTRIEGVARAGREPATVHVGRRALGHVLHEPNQLGLTRAFVTGDLRLDGRIEDVLALRVDLRGAHVAKR